MCRSFGLGAGRREGRQRQSRLLARVGVALLASASSACACVVVVAGWTAAQFGYDVGTFSGGQALKRIRVGLRHFLWRRAKVHHR